jgi:tetratricopeptide (TPR) repeat protein
MIQYPRTPAAVILAVAVGLSISYALVSDKSAATQDATGHSPRSLSQNASIGELELAIATRTADARTWFLYGQRLLGAKRYAHAAEAYKKALELEPYLRDARFNCGLALAQAGKADVFLAFVNDLLLQNPKLTVDVLERCECQPYLAQPGFQLLLKDARNRAMD